MLELKAPKVSAISFLLSHQLQWLAIQMLCQIKGCNAQVELECGAVQHVLPEVEGVHVPWCEFPPLPILWIRKEAPPLGCW